MSLLEKFDAVVVQADNRISETDKYFCETHQEAYEAALTSFKELGFFWEDMLKTQSDLLGPRHTNFFYDYLSSSKGPSISNHSIHAHIKCLHGEFIQTLVHHFNSAYHVTVSSSEVKKALLPEEPDSYRRVNEEDWDAYDEAMQTLTVKYADVVDQVILRLDGRNFVEQAFHELKTSCHKAAWNTYKQEPDFERKKDTIRFTGYGCSYDTWSNVTRWELSDSMKSILRGAAHFETGGYNMYPVGLSDLVGYGRVDHDLVLFPSCTKLKHLKMFKNRRVDIKFASEALAKEFIDTYLGTVC